MSYQYGPTSYRDPTMQEDTHWRHKSNGNANGGIASKISHSILGDDTHLPMYKDKPHFPPNRRKKFWQRRGAKLAFGVVLLTLLWWTDHLPFLNSSGTKRSPTAHHNRYHHHSQPTTDPRIWHARALEVRDAFRTTWSGYEKHAWGLDEYHPLTKSGRNMVEGGLGWIIVDALDTAMLMNLTTEVGRARDWIRTSLHYTADHDVNTFETTIRMLGGLLSAHYLSTRFPRLAPQVDDDVLQPGEDLYIEKATTLADRILGAFDTPSGIPVNSINLNTSRGVAMGDGMSSTAEAATLQLEFKHLSKVTGEPVYWETAEKVLKVIDDLQPEAGLVPIFMNPATGTFRGSNIRLGSRGDSYYEYLIKQWLQTGGREGVYREMWDEVMLGLKRYLITWTKHANMTIIGERQSGLAHDLTPKMDHLVAFMPGTIALGLTNGSTVQEAVKKGLWTDENERDLGMARELMKSFWAMYKGTKTGLAPEIAYFHVDSPARRWEFEDGWVMPVSETKEFDGEAVGKSKANKAVSTTADGDHDAETNDDVPWRKDLDFHPQDLHNLQRPETVESLFYLYHITRDPIYREWGWEMFESFREHSAVIDPKTDEVYAYASLNTVEETRVSDGRGYRGNQALRDNTESFWMAETLKYFWLLFCELGNESGGEVGMKENVMPFTLSDVVINTEAHILPRFDIKGSTVWKTGWTRKARGAEAAAAEKQVPLAEGVDTRGSRHGEGVGEFDSQGKLKSAKEQFEVKQGVIGLETKVLGGREASGDEEVKMASLGQQKPGLMVGDAEWEDRSWAADAEKHEEEKSRSAKQAVQLEEGTK